MSPDLARVIYTLSDNSNSIHAIAKQLELPRTTVRKVLARRVLGTKWQEEQRGGRPRSPSPRTDQSIVVAVKHNRTERYKSVGKRFDVSKDTVIRR